jgi:hypothetical protein
MFLKIITAADLPPQIVTNLNKCGFEVYPTCADENVLSGLNFHPDMQMARVGREVICCPAVYEYLKEIFKKTDLKLICGKKETGCNYPNDVAYNIKVAGNYAFHNFEYTDEVLMNKLEGITKIDVTQGYSGCSICYIGDNALMTSDTVIYEASQKNGIDALLIEPGHIVLNGFDYGFIGGASFYNDGTVYFFGNIISHPQYEQIKNFCIKHKTKIHTLSDGPLFDYGSAVTLD